jgi:hypothetical protein
MSFIGYYNNDASLSHQDSDAALGMEDFSAINPHSEENTPTFLL